MHLRREPKAEADLRLAVGRVETSLQQEHISRLPNLGLASNIS
jgi:hypothetical protein